MEDDLKSRLEEAEKIIRSLQIIEEQLIIPNRDNVDKAAKAVDECWDRFR